MHFTRKGQYLSRSFKAVTAVGVSVRTSFAVAVAVMLLLAGCRGNPPDTITKVTEQLAATSGEIDSGASSIRGSLNLSVRTVALPGADHLWGYEIYAADSLLIRQLQVPAVEGHFGFTRQKDAEKIGNMVIQKLKTGQLPTVSWEELKKAAVTYKPY